MSRFINVADLEVAVIQDDGTFKYVNIKDGPYVGSREDYETYQARLQKYHYAPNGEQMNEMSWEDFRALILEEFRIQDPKIKIVQQISEVVDGQHRVSALYRKYGSDAMVEVEGMGVVALWVRSTR